MSSQVRRSIEGKEEVPFQVLGILKAERQRNDDQLGYASNERAKTSSSTAAGLDQRKEGLELTNGVSPGDFTRFTGRLSSIALENEEGKEERAISEDLEKRRREGGREGTAGVELDLDSLSLSSSCISSKPDPSSDCPLS